MITPLDIQNKQFKRAFRGYKEGEVDEFLDEIIIDYEKTYKENIELKDKILMLNEQIKYYRNLEDTLKDTLVVAQSTADEVTLAARQKGENIVNDAEFMAKQIISDANDNVRKIKEEYIYLQKEIFMFKTRYKSFIESQLISIDEFYSNMEKEYLDKPEDGKEEHIEDEKTSEDLDNLGA